MELIVSFGCLALLLGAAGLYGVVSYIVASRTRDIGIRMTLGAHSHDLSGWAFLGGMGPVLTGLAAGLSCGAVIGRLLKGFLYGITAFDPLSLTGAIIVVLAFSALASYLPARRTLRVSP